MNLDELKAQQKKERAEDLREILDSDHPRKLIVAGPGTGKTFTFGELLRRSGGSNLAMTFIRKLVADMESKLASMAEVKTFHAYCKKVLHEQNGRVEIAAFLTKIVARDAVLIGNGLVNFDTKFRTLDSGSDEVRFHLSRGDYYDAVGFDDAVFRLYELLKRKPEVVPAFDQIVIDEFQDFHRLEVAFIEELVKKGKILIVGDDDQAVYDRRNASPSHLRDLHKSGDFKPFDLRFCSRCPDAIVCATNAIVQRAQAAGYLKGRIPKKYECYWPDKEADSKRYPRIITACCTVGGLIPKYIESEIGKIDPKDIAESHDEDAQYPTVLIVGAKHYLHEVAKHLNKRGVPFEYNPSDEICYGIVDAYEWLLRNEQSNLGWRILLELFFDEQMQKEVVLRSQKGDPIHSFLPKEFVDNHRLAIQLIRALRLEEKSLTDIEGELRKTLDNHFDEVAIHFGPKKLEESPSVDKTKPSILLTSFLGCKGLSAGHVFIIGVHEGSMPKSNVEVTNVEIRQFIVALTRTRKQCHIVATAWLVAPIDKNKKPIKAFRISRFLDWIPSELLENRGKISAKVLKPKKSNDSQIVV